MFKKNSIQKVVVTSANMLPTIVTWTQIINLIIQLHLKDTTICLLWPHNVVLQLNMANLQNYYTILNINRNTLEMSLTEDIEDFPEISHNLRDRGVEFNVLTLKLTKAIEKSHCESFVVFQDDILQFIESFSNASQYSCWRSKRNHFVFAYYDKDFEENFVGNTFFEDHANILLVALDALSSDIFSLKTNKYVGPKSDRQYSLILLDRFYNSNATFLYNHSLFPDKYANLQGREVVVAGFDYRPYFVINYVAKNENNSYDLSFEQSTKGSVQIDGTEARVILTFCEIYNCSVLIDSSEANDWGEVYTNLSGDGSLGMVVKGSAEIAIGAMYSWDVDYIHLDMSMYLVRSGITCLVPAPKRLASWLLPLDPFQFNLWLAVLLYLLIEILSLCCTHRFESWLLAQPFTWYNSLMFGCVTTLKIFVSQSQSKEYARLLTARVLLFTCFMNDIIITSIYGGGLASILTIPSYDEAADTVDRLYSHNLKWAANSEAWVTAIRNSDEERIKQILSNFHIYTDEQLAELASSFSNMGFSVERLPFGHFAIGDYLTSECIEHLKIMQEDLYFQYTVAFVKRCWSHLEQFDRLIYWWHSAGLDKYWEWRIVAVNLNVQKQKEVEATMYSSLDVVGPVKLGMANFVGILLIWVLGISIACLVFLYEILGDYLKCKKK